MSFKQAQEEIDAVVKKHGIGTYVFCMKDPDSDLEAFGFDGPLSWCVGAARQMERLASRAQDEIDNELDSPAGAD